MFKKLVNGVYLAEERPCGCNVYLIAGNPPILVDLREDDADELLNLAEAIVGRPRFLILTHCHYDHAGGAYIASKRGLKVAIGKGDEEVLSTGDGYRSCAFLFDRTLKPVNPSLILKGGSLLESKPYKLVVISTPGHTPGSICLYEPVKGWLFTGDTVFSDGIGRTDLPGGSLASLYSSIKKLAKLNVNSLLPGHGEPLVKGGKEALIEALSILET